MHISSSYSKSVDSGKTGNTIGLPRRKGCIDVKRAVFKVDSRIRSLEVQAGRDQPVFEGHNGLDEPRNTGSSIQVADIGFHRTHSAEAFRLRSSSKRLSEGGYFNGITQWSSCSMGFYVGDHFRTHIGHSQRFGDDLCLSIYTGGAIANFHSAVI